MKKILFTLMITLLLVSCSGNDKENSQTATGSTGTGEIKQDFLLDVKNISEFNNQADLIKTGKISSSQDISITSQVNGRVAGITKKEGQQVSKGEIIIIVSDNIVNYDLNLESAQNNLEKAKLNYESNEIKLNKLVSDIERDISNSQIDNLGSSSALELEKIENSIKKLALDYENLKISNQEQIQGFKNSFNRDFSNFSTFIENITDFSDELLGVTKENKHKNISIVNYLGAKNSKQLNDTKNLLLELISYKNTEIKGLNYNFDGTSEFNSKNLIITNGYALIGKLLIELDEVIDNSIPSVGTLSEAELSAYKSQISAYSSIYNGNNSGFVSMKNNLNSFLETYKNSEESLLKQIGLLEQDKKIYVKSLDYKIDVTNATLEEAKTNRDLTLKTLSIAITDAEIGYKQALKQYNKLSITAPISGVISSIGVDVGQEINVGTPTFSIINNSDNLVEIGFTKEELKLVKVNNKVLVNYAGDIFEGYIYSISQIADSNLKYKSNVKIKDKINLIGNIVSVTIPVKVENKLIPVNIVKIGSDNKGTINVLVDGKIEQKEIKLGKIYNEKIEILENPKADFIIILNYVDNYDPEKFNLKINDINE